MLAKFSYFFLFFLILSTTYIFPQSLERPKLVVGIVIDQTRFDYLYRFYDGYSENGFKRLMNEGSNFTFAHYNYEYTSTGPGHATIYTGTTPYYHGIIANDLYIRDLKKSVYCLEDDNYPIVGSNNVAEGVSPKWLLSTTITDELKLATNGKSKVISISSKDRGAVLPGGHNPDGAFWYDSKTGNFISSTYYFKELPNWVKAFNNKKLPDKYLAEGWKLSLPIEKYSINPSDESAYEKDRFNEGKTSFPHFFNNLTDANKYAEFENTPFGNDLVNEFVKTALVSENLGKGTETDFLAISFSATDHVGHEYGTVSYELQDAYIKLDEQISDLLNTLDEQVGKGNYVLFLTADHAALQTPQYLKDERMPSGELNTKVFLDSIKAFAKRNYGDENLIKKFFTRQIYLNKELIVKKKINFHLVQQDIADYLRETFPAITSIYTRDFLETQVSSRDQRNFTVNGFNPVLSGDIFIVLKPGYMTKFLQKGTQHETGFTYDTHVPLIFYGWHIPAQTINTPVYIIDIAPTISDLIKIPEPSASIGIPLIK